MHEANRRPKARSRRWAALALLTVATALALSGCVRVQAGLSVSDDDTVSGQLVIASVAIKQEDTGPTLKVPPELGGKVKATVYAADGYVGQTLTLQEVTFPEMTLLAGSITSGKQYRLNFRRSGDLVSLSGSVDLSELPADRADIRLSVTFPGTITRTNGVNDHNTVTWKPKPGTVTEMNATTQYSGQGGVSWTKWVAIVGAAAVGVALLVLLLALVTHRRSLRHPSPL